MIPLMPEGVEHAGHPILHFYRYKGDESIDAGRR
jgi:hypothetical protein